MPDLHPDISTRAPEAAPPALRGPAVRLAAAALAGALGVAALAFALVGPVLEAMASAIAAYLAAAGLTVASLRRDYPHDSLGLCNLVTLARLGLTSALLAPLLSPASGWAVLAVALMVLSLDGVDGWLARRERLVSDFGARFDMEVDAALGLILALNAWASGSVGPAVLLLGLPRYAFVAGAAVMPWLARPLPERFGRKTVCVLQIGILIALQAPLFAEPAGAPVAGVLVAAGAVALCWSFGRDTLWLWRTRS